jgi:general secretion pathway protein H
MRGFTLLEVLLALAIIMLLGGVLVGGSARLLGETPQTTGEIFWKAVQEARKAALKAEHDMRLRFDKEKKQFVLLDGMAPVRLAADGFTREEVPLKTFPLPPAVGDVEISFLSATKGGPTIMVGGVLIESQPVPYVTFYSDGTCTPFRVQFVRSGAASTVGVDPWTCAPVLTANDPNAPAP